MESVNKNDPIEQPKKLDWNDVPEHPGMLDEVSGTESHGTCQVCGTGEGHKTPEDEANCAEVWDKKHDRL